MSKKVNCFVYGNIPGAGKGWTLAVFAISRKDADNYMIAHYRGGAYKLEYEQPSGKVNANCGATTEQARLNAREYV